MTTHVCRSASFSWRNKNGLVYYIATWGIYAISAFFRNDDSCCGTVFLDEVSIMPPVMCNNTNGIYYTYIIYNVCVCTIRGKRTASIYITQWEKRDRWKNKNPACKVLVKLICIGTHTTSLVRRVIYIPIYIYGLSNRFVTQIKGAIIIIIIVVVYRYMLYIHIQHPSVYSKLWDEKGGVVNVRPLISFPS